MTEILDQTIGVDLGTITDGKDTDKVNRHDHPRQDYRRDTIGIIIGEITDKAIIGNKGIEVKVGTVTEITTKTIQEKGMTKAEIQVGIEVEKDSQDHGPEQNQKVGGILIDEEQNQDPDQVQELVQTETGLGVICEKSMITLQENVPTLLQMRTQMVQNKPPYKC